MIVMTSKGLFCEAGGFYIDPSRKVDVALITHAHSDHARAGSSQYYCVRSGAGLLQHRLGERAMITGVEYRQKLRFGPIEVSFHPAGHILGSAQIRVTDGREVWVVSGDYKRELDPTCEEFEVVPCDTFVTEATFGNPQYSWKNTGDVAAQILAWWEDNASIGRNSLLYCYSLGKTQRVLAELARVAPGRHAHTYGEAWDLTECYRREGVRMIETRNLENVWAERGGRYRLCGELIVAPHSINRSPWLARLDDPETAFASGWMGSSRRFSWGGYGRGFVMSDHADWPALLRTIEETGASRVLVQHAGCDSLIKHLRKAGIPAAHFVPEPKLSANAAALRGTAVASGQKVADPRAKRRLAVSCVERLPPIQGELFGTPSPGLRTAWVDDAEEPGEASGR